MREESAKRIRQQRGVNPKTGKEINLIDFDSDRPKNKPRKVIFRDNSGLSTKQKQQIIGKLIGKQKKATPEDIYEAMLTINDNKEKITIKKIATILNVSTR